MESDPSRNSVKQARNFFKTGEVFCRRQVRAVRTGGNPEGSGRKTNPGRLIKESAAVVGATPNPAEMSHILIWISGV